MNRYTWEDIKEEMLSQIDGKDKDNAKDVLANIEYGKQTIGSQDGGDTYMLELLDMEKFIKSCFES